MSFEHKYTYEEKEKMFGKWEKHIFKKLHEVTQLPLIHLDNIWWKKGRTHISREEFDKKLAEILRGDKWIIDGDYSRTYEVRSGKQDYHSLCHSFLY